jgi:hypothetical protein
MGVDQDQPAQTLGIPDRELRGDPAAEAAAKQDGSRETERVPPIEQPEDHVVRAIDPPERRRVIEAGQARCDDIVVPGERVVTSCPPVARRVVEPERGTLPTEKFGMSVPSPVCVAIFVSRSRTVAGLPTTTKPPF